MARVTREVVVCDVCGSEADVATVTVAVDGAEQSAELCAVHRQHLQEAVAGVLRTLTAAEQPAAEQPAAEQPAPARRGRKTAAGRTPAARPAAARTSTTRTRTAPPGRRMPTTTCPHCGLELGVQNLGRHIAAKHPGAA
jgi:ribosome-binding protein aMBF1 (putative translation factor)